MKMKNINKISGYFKLENVIAEALATIKLSENLSKVLWVIMRKTWGWQKNEDFIPLSQFSKLTNIKDRGNIHNILKKLADKNIIRISKHNNRCCYSINKQVELWKDVVAQDKVVSKNNVISKNNHKLSQRTTNKANLLHTDTNSKEKIKTAEQKTITSKSQQSHVQRLVAYYIKLYKKKFGREPVIGPTSWGKWGKLLKTRMSQGFSLEEIAQLLLIFYQSKDSDPTRLGFDLGTFFSDAIFNKTMAIKGKQHTSDNKQLEKKYDKWK